MMSDDEKEHTGGDRTVVTSIQKVDTPEGKRAYILFLAGPLVGKLHLLEEGETTIGRSADATIAINDNRISRRHVAIQVAGEAVTMRDLGSTNGTFVNGQRVAECRLTDGDKVQISSSTIFKFALQDRTENIFHKELYKMAVLDPVTNIYNKRFFLERLAEELSHARRARHPLGLLMIDIDHFKQVNDQYGHLAGDMVLHQVAALLKAMVRQEDLLARYGGEEFSIILRGASEAKALLLAERMREAVANATITFEANPVPVTISIGVAAQDEGQDYATGKAFIQHADECLYYSKQHGRNRTTAVSTKT